MLPRSGFIRVRVWLGWVQRAMLPSLPNRIQGVAQSVKETNVTPAEALKPRK